jgi:pimeloyl-ACP methyl ester carboxylesterase
MSLLRYIETPAVPQAAAGPRPRVLGTIVLLHAFPLNARMWEPQQALAEFGWRIVAPQFPGFDGGTGAHANATVDDYAGQLVDLLDSLHVEQAVIAGLSMGGYVAFALLRHARRYFSGLVLADTRSQADTPEGQQGREKMRALLRDKGPSAIADEMIPKLLGASTLKERPAVGEHVRALIMSSSADAIDGAINVLKTRPDSTPLLSGIHVPTLIVVGEEDTLTPPDMSREMHRAIHGSELVVIPESGHLSNLERPRAFNAALASFLTDRV